MQDVMICTIISTRKFGATLKLTIVENTRPARKNKRPASASQASAGTTLLLRLLAYSLCLAGRFAPRANASPFPPLDERPLP